MTETLERAISRARDLPAAAQDTLAHVLLDLIGGDGIVALSTEERRAIDQSRDAARRGDFADESEVRDVWEHFDR